MRKGANLFGCLMLVMVMFNVSCKQKPAEKPLFDLMEGTGIRFSNDITNTPDFNIFTYRNFYNGGGVAIGDINNDGLLMFILLPIWEVISFT